MFKKLSKKSVMLFVGVMAVAAFAMPAMASAANWGIVGSAHTLTSTNLSFNVAAIGAGSSCADSQFNADVRSAAVLTVTSATFTSCTGTGGAVHCAATVRGTNFHWSGTGLTTTDIRINGVNVDVLFEQKPGDPTACGQFAGNVSLTGTLGTGAAGATVWDAAAHQVTITGAEGLTAHGSFGSLPATVTGTIRDSAQTLTLS
jgi:hypothetical protein